MTSEAENLVDAYGDAQRALGAHREAQFLSVSDLMADADETATLLFRVKETRTALIARLARDDARIARLEEVAVAARKVIDFNTASDYLAKLGAALDALDDPKQAAT